jgi:hypothetical protein
MHHGDVSPDIAQGLLTLKEVIAAAQIYQRGNVEALDR